MNAALAEPAVGFRISAQDIDDDRVAEAVAPLLQRACDHSGGRFEPAHIAHGLREGFFQVWGVARGARLLCVCVTTLHTYPTGLKTLEVILLGGERRDVVLPFMKVLASFGADHGCERVEFFGRRGFEREIPEAKIAGLLFEVEI